MGPRARICASLTGPMPRPFSRALALMLLALLAACVPLGQGNGDAPTPAPAEEISVTALPPAGGAEGAAPVQEGPGPDDAAPEAQDAETEEAATVAEEPVAETPEEAAPPPPPPLSPEALACQRRGGEYRGTGSGNLKACIKPTGEGGKSCTKETDCTGVCLARSGTCAPVTPLFGCNEILQADGRRVTLCIE